MAHRIYPSELQLNKANDTDTEAAFLDSNLSIHNDTVSTKIYDKRDDFDFYIVNFPFLDGDVPRCPSYGVYILNKKKETLHFSDKKIPNLTQTQTLKKYVYVKATRRTRQPYENVSKLIRR